MNSFDKENKMIKGNLNETKKENILKRILDDSADGKCEEV